MFAAFIFSRSEAESGRTNDAVIKAGAKLQHHSSLLWSSTQYTPPTPPVQLGLYLHPRQDNNMVDAARQVASNSHKTNITMYCTYSTHVQSVFHSVLSNV